MESYTHPSAHVSKLFWNHEIITQIDNILIPSEHHVVYTDFNYEKVFELFITCTNYKGITDIKKLL